MSDDKNAETGKADTPEADELLDRSTEPLDDYATSEVHGPVQVDTAEADADAVEDESPAPGPDAQEPPD
ncbi:hypothetical protein [Actinokineospora cianjurensis]|uniref:hypothetical protein n=1 Tax=Actinokineospora cianjurensis TaxID=585224 RepID=UPI000EB54FE9|nr:hypothetical protein [Actinokineospora cianjurensis]